MKVLGWVNVSEEQRCQDCKEDGEETKAGEEEFELQCGLFA